MKRRDAFEVIVTVAGLLATIIVLYVMGCQIFGLFKSSDEANTKVSTETNKNSILEDVEITNNNDVTQRIVCDTQTGVMYLICSNGDDVEVTPMYNSDGTLKVKGLKAEDFQALSGE